MQAGCVIIISFYIFLSISLRTQTYRAEDLFCNLNNGGFFMVSQKLKAALKLGAEPAYMIAHKAGINPSTLSKLVCGIIKVQSGDHRVLMVGKILGLKPEECFKKGTAI